MRKIFFIMPLIFFIMCGCSNTNNYSRDFGKEFAEAIKLTPNTVESYEKNLSYSLCSIDNLPDRHIITFVEDKYCYGGDECNGIESIENHERIYRFQNDGNMSIAYCYPYECRDNLLKDLIVKYGQYDEYDNNCHCYTWHGKIEETKCNISLVTLPSERCLFEIAPVN
ncbi:MAG: hypothetical protein Q8873_01780 [Bacillota bacterium]|nr:hypothetical protein [Bacillota bacterium]